MIDLRRFSRANRGGFTLPELLISTIIAAGVAAVTAQVMIGQLLEGRRLAAAQQLRENSSRINYLIQIEASEAEDVDVSGLVVPCTGGGTAEFSLLVPIPDGPYGLGTSSQIHYYNRDNSIWRCGPRVFRNGVLDHVSDPVGGRVVDDAQLEVDPDCANVDEVSDERRVVFSISYPLFPGINPGDGSICSVAHARSVFVCNPARPGNPQPGEC